MKISIALLLYLGAASVASGEVFTRGCRADGKTPLELADPNLPFVYRDIMVGTKLTIIVGSNTDGYWGGDLAIVGEDRNYGVLSARNYSDATDDWAGSRLPAVGDMARVWDWEEPDVKGFNLQGHRSARAGDWFIIDYTATNVGICHVGFYDYSVSPVDPIYYLTFSQVPTRDFNQDTNVDFADFAMLASLWQGAVCQEQDWCEGIDIDADGKVDLNDLFLFADYWLERTE